MSLLLLFHPKPAAGTTIVTADLSSDGTSVVTLASAAVSAGAFAMDGSASLIVVGAVIATADVSSDALAQLSAEGASVASGDAASDGAGLLTAEAALVAAADIVSDGTSDAVMEGASIGGTQTGDVSIDGVADVQFEGVEVNAVVNVSEPISDFAPVASYGGKGWTRGFPSTMPQHRPEIDDDVLEIIKRMAPKIAHEARMRRYA